MAIYMVSITSLLIIVKNSSNAIPPKSSVPRITDFSNVLSCLSSIYHIRQFNTRLRLSKAIDFRSAWHYTGISFRARRNSSPAVKSTCMLESESFIKKLIWVRFPNRRYSPDKGTMIFICSCLFCVS